MKRFVAGMLLAALASGCKLYLWAGSHELEFPPEVATPTPTPEP
ncbi:MAG: hypothetical protein ACREQQ_01865 [Candidatus Binatia bacterium]